ncbi:MAG: radC [candidate division NC10 bacterium]|nr:radC [candidate division NC10 bacterium]MBF8278953.1 radC [candidate division NC10 bacterium]
MGPKQRYVSAIKAWPAEERPRERLLMHGPGALTTAELLAILLRTGTGGQSAVELARSLLEKAGGLRELDRRAAEELQEAKGLGPAKIAQLKAALELGRRLMAEEKKVLAAVTSSKEVYEWLRPQMQGLTKEVFKVLLLNGNNEILESVTASEGSLTESPVYLRDLVNLANRHQAAALIVAHNHPSGNPRPSPTDKTLTEELVFMGRLLKIRVLDHLIIGENRYYSFADEGLIDQYAAAFDARRGR